MTSRGRGSDLVVAGREMSQRTCEVCAVVDCAGVNRGLCAKSVRHEVKVKLSGLIFVADSHRGRVV
jgi:hypothetical protein